MLWFPDVRAHPRTLRDILHHVLSVFRQISNSCSWISSLERVRVKGSDLFLGHGFLKILGGLVPSDEEVL